MNNSEFPAATLGKPYITGTGIFPPFRWCVSFSSEVRFGSAIEEKREFRWVHFSQ